MSDFTTQFALGQEAGRRLVRAALDRLGLEANTPDELRRLVLSVVETSGLQVVADAIEETARSHRFAEVMPMMVGVYTPRRPDRVDELIPTWALARAATLVWECRAALTLGVAPALSSGVAEHYTAQISLWLHSDTARHGVPLRSSEEVARA
jgi:hypothetical protein